MDRTPPGPMTPFDELVTTPQLQMIKLLLPFAPEPGRRPMALVIKFLELKNTVSLFQNRRFCLTAQSVSSDSDNVLDFIELLKPYLGSEMSDMIDLILNMKTLFASGDLSPDLFMGMMSPEQQDLFHSCADGFPDADGPCGEQARDLKGDDTIERVDEQPEDPVHGSGQT